MTDCLQVYHTDGSGLVKCRNDILFNLNKQLAPTLHCPLPCFLPSYFFINLIEVRERFVPVLGGGDGLDHLVHGGHVAAPLVAALHPHARLAPGLQAAHPAQHLGVLGGPAPDTLGRLETVGPHWEAHLGLTLGGRRRRDDPRPIHPQQPGRHGGGGGPGPGGGGRPVLKSYE